MTEIKFLRNPPGALGSQSFTAKLDAASAAIVSSPPAQPAQGAAGPAQPLWAAGAMCGSCANWYPPVITRTAATPQGSPAALDLNVTERDVHEALQDNDVISIESTTNHLALNFASASIISIDKSPVSTASLRTRG